MDLKLHRAILFGFSPFIAVTANLFAVSRLPLTLPPFPGSHRTGDLGSFGVADPIAGHASASVPPLRRKSGPHPISSQTAHRQM